jgi:hypothetical protein
MRRRSNRVTGLQAAQVSLRAQLEVWSEQLSPYEYAVLLDLLSRMLEVERRRAAHWLRRAA